MRTNPRNIKYYYIAVNMTHPSAGSVIYDHDDSGNVFTSLDEVEEFVSKLEHKFSYFDWKFTIGMEYTYSSWMSKEFVPMPTMSVSLDGN